MPKSAEQPKSGKVTPTPPSILPDSDEERASDAMINKWVGIADAVLADKKTRKIA